MLSCRVNNRRGDVRDLLRKSLERGIVVSYSRSISDGMIRFYEWSDLDRSPLLFVSMDSFVRFLSSCGIKYYPYDVISMESMKDVYATCIAGERVLVYASTKALLEKEMLDDIPF